MLLFESNHMPMTFTPSSAALRAMASFKKGTVEPLLDLLPPPGQGRVSLKGLPRITGRDKLVFSTMKGVVVIVREAPEVLRGKQAWSVETTPDSLETQTAVASWLS